MNPLDLKRFSKALPICESAEAGGGNEQVVVSCPIPIIAKTAAAEQQLARSPIAKVLLLAKIADGHEVRKEEIDRTSKLACLASLQRR